MVKFMMHIKLDGLSCMVADPFQWISATRQNSQCSGVKWHGWYYWHKLCVCVCVFFFGGGVITIRKPQEVIGALYADVLQTGNILSKHKIKRIGL